MLPSEVEMNGNSLRFFIEVTDEPRCTDANN